jgi:hypothetical protein
MTLVNAGGRGHGLSAGRSRRQTADAGRLHAREAHSAREDHTLTQETENRRRERNEIEQDTQAAVRQKNLDAEKQKLDIQRQEQFLRLEQEQQAKFRAAERQVKEAEIERDRMVKQKSIEAERTVQVQGVERSPWSDGHSSPFSAAGRPHMAAQVRVGGRFVPVQQATKVELIINLKTAKMPCPRRSPLASAQGPTLFMAEPFANLPT